MSDHFLLLIRLGADAPQYARSLVYQHVTSKRDQEIAAAIDARTGRGGDR